MTRHFLVAGLWLSVITITTVPQAFSQPSLPMLKVHLSNQSNPLDLRDVLSHKIQFLKNLVKHPDILQAVQQHNAQALSLAEIQQRDAAWRAALLRQPPQLTALQQSLQNNRAAQLLRQTLLLDTVVYSEAFLADAQGANIAAYPVTSDYWQGDEKKWLRCFNQGQGRVFIGPIAFDHSTRIHSVHISIPVKVQQQTVGVLVVGVKLNYIETLLSMSLQELLDVPIQEF